LPNSRSIDKTTGCPEREIRREYVKTAFRTAAVPPSTAPEIAPAGPPGLQRSAAQGLRLQLAEVVTSTSATVAVLILLLGGRWVPGFAPSAAVFVAIAVLPPVLRTLSQTFPRSRALDIAASFWLIPAAAFGHSYLGPLVDAVQPRLRDAYLAFADLQLFGIHPSVAVTPYASPWLTEVLMICYYSYFVFALVLGIARWWRGRGKGS